MVVVVDIFVVRRIPNLDQERPRSNVLKSLLFSLTPLKVSLRGEL